MQRLNDRGRGILLLHDIHPATALALPSLLKELKEQGYKVVHVVPVGDMPKSVPELPAPAATANGAPRENDNKFLLTVSNLLLRPGTARRFIEKQIHLSVRDQSPVFHRTRARRCCFPACLRRAAESRVGARVR